MMHLTKTPNKNDVVFFSILLLYIAAIISLTLKVDTQITSILRVQFISTIIFITVMSLKKDYRYLKIVYQYSLIPIVLLILNSIATQEFHFKSYTRDIFFAYTFFTSLLMIVLYAISKYGWPKVLTFIKYITQALIIIYTLIQASVVFFQFGPAGKSGTTSNPHFLALYSAIFFFIAMYFFTTILSYKRYIFLIASIILLSLILYTSSRPIWIAMTINLFFIFSLTNKKKFFKFISIFILLQIILWHFNPFNYAGRSADLYKNIRNEERVTIWEDTWQLQKNSTPTQWIVGHGLNSFYEDFKLVSRSRDIKDFRSPHNSLLEFIYITGIVGFSLMLWLFYYMFNYLIKLRKIEAYKRFSTLAIALLIVIVFLNGLNFSLFNNSYLFPIVLFLVCIEILKTQIHQNT